MPVALYGTDQKKIGKRQNKFKSFFDDLNKKRKEKKKNADKKIKNDNAANEKAIIEVLEEIDFGKSKLDQGYLDFKTYSSQEYGDLEQARNDIKRMIITNNQFTNLKLSEFDKKLYIIACSFRNAISNGHQNAAFSSQSALYIAIDQIRNQLAFIPEQWCQRYLDECTDYLDKWIQLIEECISMDATSIALSNSEEKLNEKLEKSKKEVEEFKDDMKKDKQKAAALAKVEKYPIKDTLKDPMLRSIFNLLIDHKIEQTSLYFDIQMTKMQRRSNKMYATQVEMLRKNVQNVPIPKDPLSFQKFQDSVKKMLDQIDEIDKQYGDFLLFLFKVDGELDRLENSMTSEIEKDIARKEIEKMVEAINNENQKDNIDKLSHRELLKKLGIKEEEDKNRQFVNDTEEEDQFNEN